MRARTPVAHNRLVDVLVIGGGVIPEDDYEFLKSKGIAAVFGPGTPTKTTIDFIRNNLKRK